MTRSKMNGFQLNGRHSIPDREWGPFFLPPLEYGFEANSVSFSVSIGIIPYVRFQVLKAENMKMSAFWLVAAL
jgi:hypothetical protein